MKTKIGTTLGLALLLAVMCGNLSAQSTSTTGTTSPTAATSQSVINTMVTNPNVLVITGKIYDATTQKPIDNAKINFDKAGVQLMHASIDEQGNYTVALNKDQMGDAVKVLFKVSGYKRYMLKNLDKNANYVDVDVYLEPVNSDDSESGHVTYVMDDSPFNPLVIKMQ